MVNDSTRGYSVYLSDETNNIRGSGILFYPGGDFMFVFTAAHVVDGLKNIRIAVLKEIDSSTDNYEEYHTEVVNTQVFYSPLDKVTVQDGERIHSEDLAIIKVAKPSNIDITITNFFVTEKYRNSSVYIQGFPNGVPDNEKTIEYLDCLHGYILVNSADGNRFTVKIDDNTLDKSNRISELEGLSGSPVWDDNEQENGLLGLLSQAYGTTALLSKVFSVKSRQIRSLMKDKFNIVIERKLDGVTDDEIAVKYYKPTEFNGTLPLEETIEYNKWIDDGLSTVYEYLQDYKLQKAIDKARDIVADPRYGSLDKEVKSNAKKHLLYCYEIAYMDDEFDALEEEMRGEGLIEEHDVLRQFTRSFMKKQYHKTKEAAQLCIDTWNGTQRESILSFAKVFLFLSKAYVDNLSVEETILKILDDKENIIYPTDKIEDTALIYQMIGYVYGEKYHDYINAVRFLNRAFSIGDDSIVLESLAAAYYFLAISNATDEAGRISDISKIDRKMLYKARECFLIIKEKADDLFWSGTMTRMGLCVYNTFVFMQDNYRVLTMYQDVKKYLHNLNNDEWRDVERKYAIICAQKGEIDTSMFTHITKEDKAFLTALASSARCFSMIYATIASIPRERIKNISEFEAEIKNTIQLLEESVAQIDNNDRPQIYINLIDIYGQGTMLLGWDSKDRIVDLFDSLRSFGNEDMLKSISNYIYELENPIEESIKRFKDTFEKKKDIHSWLELNKLYIRHGLFDEADNMYRTLFSEHNELIKDEPEFAYRGFIDYVTMYKRDLKFALQCYLDAKDSFKDTDIEGFWELELMWCSNSFNEPDRFETERKHFVDKGLVSLEIYHSTAFIAQLTNLNENKAKEHFDYLQQRPFLFEYINAVIDIRKGVTQFLNWIGAIQPNFPPPPDSMIDQRAETVRKKYDNETWHRKIDKQFLNQFRIKKEIAIDAWSLYQLAYRDTLDDLEQFDSVNVTHLSIIRLLDELSRTGNQRIRTILNYLKASEKMHIYSAGFKAQLEVRNVTDYFEPESTAAVAVEKDCIFVYGDPVVNEKLIERFGKQIIRISDLDKVIK